LGAGIPGPVDGGGGADRAGPDQPVGSVGGTGGLLQGQERCLGLQGNLDEADPGSPALFGHVNGGVARQAAEDGYYGRRRQVFGKKIWVFGQDTFL